MKTPDPQTVRRLYRRIGCHPVTASVLVNRNIVSEADASIFLSPSLQQVTSYSSLKDMEKAVHRIAEAIGRHENILVFGDYDVDGITSTTIVSQFLKQAGAEADCYIPHRVTEGYGLRLSHIQDVVIPGGYDLIITVDCGSSSHEAVRAAKDAGIDVIITDHHDISDLPPADAVINPKRADCTSGLEYLAGVGVAFFLLVCLRKHLREIGHWNRHPEPNLKDICDLVALGTIADIVPLVRENRVIARTGLDVMNAAPRPGIKALIDRCGINKPMLETDDLSFRLAPRLNAAGRMDHAMVAANLLIAEDETAAGPLADLVHAFNVERQNTENQIHQRIRMFLNQDEKFLENRSLVLADEQWHLGVLGIVASRLAEEHFRPVVLFSITDGIGVGSARSIPGIDLYSTLCECAPFLEAFGGHAMAAGLRIKRERINAFRRAFDDCIARSHPGNMFQPHLVLDADLPFDRISDQLTDELERLQPYGQQNPEPLFCTSGVRAVFSKIVGGRHRRMVLVQTASKTGKKIPAMQFNIDPSIPPPDAFDRIAYRLRWNYYNGQKQLQLIIEEAE